MYGIPHSENGRVHPEYINIEENSLFHEMGNIQDCIESSAKNAINSGDFIYIFGDLPDTPDNSKKSLWEMQTSKTSVCIISGSEELCLLLNIPTYGQT